jgi:hypothetical protein
MFLDEHEEVLYIGSSIHLVTRIESQHFLSQNGNLNEECILQTHKILYHQCLSDSDMKIKERYLINTLVPRNNVKMNKSDKFSFVIDNINWTLFSIDNEGLVEKRRNLIYKKTELINHFLDSNSDLLIIEKPNSKNYLKINNETWDVCSSFFIKINNEFYYHHLNRMSYEAGYSIKDGIRIYQNVEYKKSRHGFHHFIWVDSADNDSDLFIFEGCGFRHPDESEESFNLSHRKLLFIEYNYIRKNDYLISDNEIKKYNSLLGITEIFEREII